MNPSNSYQVAIVGGGLAGLTLAIQMADAGYSCVLFEKNKFPFHKVCGEYISMESWNFLERLGLKLSEMDLPKIKKLHISSLSGQQLQHNLDLGGFGISRFLLDSKLAEIAINKGVHLVDNCKVHNVKFDGNTFSIETENDIYSADICVGAWGKHSNLDNKLARWFTTSGDKSKNYVGIKYHVKLDFPNDLIELHNFKSGYCGISKIEENKYCLCYLTDSKNLKNNNGNIKQMEERVLMKNPFLKKYLSEAQFLFDTPLAISQIKIGYKKSVENNILMLGDAAGNIAPLSGNGMSIAMRSSFFLNTLLIDYFNKKTTRQEMEKLYEQYWKKQFKKRINLSRYLQMLLKNERTTNIAIETLKKLPFLKKLVVKSTHGNPF
ncbi:MAG: NAD(P)/FAD-dependent oxidoreductase [Bacteroidota bacterium]